MEQAGDIIAPPPASTSWSERFKDLGLLGLLLVLTLALRGWLLTTTEVAARDSIGYIRYALEFEKEPFTWQRWETVLKNNHQHPGYPLSLLVASWPVREYYGATDPHTMQVSAQIVSNLAAVLLLFPMYFLGKIVWDRQIGFWGALLFQVLPVSGHLLSDGLSEGLFLLICATTLMLAAQGFRDRSPLRFGLCGLCGGLAYLTRPEGALLVGVTGIVLLGLRVVPGWRRPWREVLASTAALAVAALAIGSLYFVATGCFSNKPSVDMIIHGQTAALSAVDPEPLVGEPSTNRPLLASLYGVVLRNVESLPARVRQGLWALGTELLQGFHYLGAGLAVLGLWWQRRLLRTSPAFCVMVLACGVHFLVLINLVVKVGYVSDRHIQLLILTGSYLIAAGARELPGRIVRRWRAVAVAPPTPRAALAVLLLLVAICLPKTLLPLHGNRAGHHSAGLWLAEHIKPGDVVQDDHCWAHYFAGEVLREGKTPPPPPGYHPIRYVVVGRSRDPEIDAVRKVDENKIQAVGHVVYHWPSERPIDAAKVVVYAVPEGQLH